jgi:hypothetical protein
LVRLTRFSAELCFPATAMLLNRIFFGTRISVEQGAGFLLLLAAILSWQASKTKPIRETDCAIPTQAVPAPHIALRN